MMWALVAQAAAADPWSNAYFLSAIGSLTAAVLYLFFDARREHRRTRKALEECVEDRAWQQGRVNDILDCLLLEDQRHVMKGLKHIAEQVKARMENRRERPDSSGNDFSD